MAKAPALDMTGIARRQLHVILALDCSGSMRGDRIASLNYALRTALPELRAVTADNPEVEVRARVLRFADTAEWLGDAVPVADLKLTDLKAGGETSMGAALALMAAALTKDAMPGRQLPPVLVIASDGLPTDDVDAGLDALLSAELARSAIRLGVAIGGDADTEVLERFMANPTLRPLRANNASALVEHIKWATTAPVKAASAPTNAPDQLIPPSNAADVLPADSEIIW